MLSTSHPRPTNLPLPDVHAGLPSGTSVLILDGDARLRTALSASFLRYGWQVKAASSFREALRVISHQSLDLVISDVTVPDGDVLELIAALHKYTPATPVIVLASHASVADVVQVMRAGAFDVLARSTCLNLLQDSARKAVATFGSSQGSFPGSTAAANMAAGMSTPLSSTYSPPAATGMTLSELSRKHLEEALLQSEGNRTNAARALGISVRTIRNKIRQYGLPPRSQR